MEGEREKERTTRIINERRERGQRIRDKRDYERGEERECDDRGEE